MLPVPLPSIDDRIYISPFTFFKLLDRKCAYETILSIIELRARIESTVLEGHTISTSSEAIT